jgi:hypothetical protein
MHKFSLRRRHDEDEPRRRRSYANITATLALVFALGGGTAWAAHSYLITSTHQIKPSVLKTLRGNRGPRGFAGLTGAAGSAGANGAAGAAGAAGAVGAVGRSGRSHRVVNASSGPADRG